MSKLNLGFECLIETPAEQKENVLSYEYLDTVFEYNASCEELNVVFDRFDSLLRAADNLKAVADVIKEQGVTPALEALVGENFSDGLSAESVNASVESVGEGIKNFLSKVWQAIKAFFINLFSSSKGLVDRLKKWLESAEAASAEEFKSRAFKGFSKNMLYAGGFAKYVAGITNESMEVRTASDLELSEVSLSFDEAKKYAKALIDGMEAVQGKKETILKFVDGKIDAAKNLEDESKKEEETKAAKQMKETVNKAWKGMNTSAAGFLAANSIKGKKEEKPAEKPAEEPKNE